MIFDAEKHKLARKLRALASKIYGISVYSREEFEDCFIEFSKSYSYILRNIGVNVYPHFDNLFKRIRTEIFLANLETRNKDKRKISDF